MSNYLTKDNKTDDLLPCANCGGEAEWRDGSSTPPYIRCKACGMRTYGSTVRGYRQKLAAVWNARARMNEFVWHDMEDEHPKIGKNDYLVLGVKGGLYLAKRFEESYNGQHYYFRDTRGNNLYQEQVLAWAEVPPYEGPELGVYRHANG